MESASQEKCIYVTSVDIRGREGKHIVRKVCGEGGEGRKKKRTRGEFLSSAFVAVHTREQDVCSSYLEHDYVLPMIHISIFSLPN